MMVLFYDGKFIYSKLGIQEAQTNTNELKMTDPAEMMTLQEHTCRQTVSAVCYPVALHSNPLQ
jgi:hypothetical protein